MELKTKTVSVGEEIGVHKQNILNSEPVDEDTLRIWYIDIKGTKK